MGEINRDSFCGFIIEIKGGTTLYRLGGTNWAGNASRSVTLSASLNEKLFFEPSLVAPAINDEVEDEEKEDSTILALICTLSDANVSGANFEHPDRILALVFFEVV